MRVAGFVCLAATLAACDAHPFDPAEQPAVTVSASAAPQIAWTPAGAPLVRVYRGATAGDGYGEALVWSIAAADGQNSIAGPVTYGMLPTGATVDVAPQALVAGQTYTAEVTRRDPRGTGDGFTNTGHRYVGTASFTEP